MLIWLGHIEKGLSLYDIIVDLIYSHLNCNL